MKCEYNFHPINIIFFITSRHLRGTSHMVKKFIIFNTCSNYYFHLFNKFVKNKVMNKRLKHKYKVLIIFHIWIVFIHIYLILNISLTIVNLSYIRKIMFWDSNSTNSMLWWWTCLLVSYLCSALYTYYIAPTPKLKVCLVSDTIKCSYNEYIQFSKIIICVIVVFGGSVSVI
jgi:hypothetical protein